MAFEAIKEKLPELENLTEDVKTIPVQHIKDDEFYENIISGLQRQMENCYFVLGEDELDDVDANAVHRFIKRYLYPFNELYDYITQN